MAYSKENFRRIAESYREKANRAREDAEMRRKTLEFRFPEIAKIDAALSSTGIRIMRAVQGDPATYGERMEALKKENAELLSARAAVLESKGIPADYDDIHYDCGICMDTGYADGQMCACMKKALILAGYESSGIGKLIARQNFENFDLSFYEGEDRLQMAQNLATVKTYAEAFSANKMRNLLFIGKTGLGKTHLSSAAAKVLIERGFDVVYETAQNILSDFEYERYGRGYNNTEPSRTDRYFECDLLIIDDLGTEISNAFSVATLYSLLNARLTNEKSMIISTNIGKEELFSRYADRITSRIFGEFDVLLFCGKDVRSQKIARGKNG